MRKSLRCPEWLIVAVLAVILSSCDDSDPTEILGSEVERAYQAWQDLGAMDYRFEIVSISVFLSSRYDVTVEDGSVVSARDSDGTEVAGYGLTIDALWQDILGARTAGNLHFASFDPQGVPDVVDYGDWEVDGGVTHRIVSFEPR